MVRAHKPHNPAQATLDILVLAAAIIIANGFKFGTLMTYHLLSHPTHIRVTAGPWHCKATG